MRLKFLLAGLVSVTACVKDPPPVSVAEFMENSRLLEATVVRCDRNRTELKYTAMCVNARDAINRLEVREKQARRHDLEAQSESKRQALRQTQAAAAEARNRALETQKRLEEAEYLGEFETLAPDDSDVSTAPGVSDGGGAGTVGGIPPANPSDNETVLNHTAQDVAVAGSDAVSDLAAIREELKRRQEEPQ